MSDNIVDLANEAQKRGKFSLADAIKGRAFPEASVDIYVDGASAYEFTVVKEAAAKLDASSPEHDAALLKMEELSSKIKESKLTFHMRGVGQGKVEEVIKAADAKYPEKAEGDNTEWLKFYLCSLIASNITKVSNIAGEEDESQFSVEDVIAIRDSIPIDSWEVLVDTMQKLTLASSYFESVTDSGFLPKS